MLDGWMLKVNSCAASAVSADDVSKQHVQPFVDILRLALAARLQNLIDHPSFDEIDLTQACALHSSKRPSRSLTLQDIDRYNISKTFSHSTSHLLPETS